MMMKGKATRTFKRWLMELPRASGLKIEGIIFVPPFATPANPAILPMVSWVFLPSRGKIPHTAPSWLT